MVSVNPNGTGIIWQTRLDDKPVPVAAGMVTGEKDDVAAAMEKRVLLYTPANNVYSQIASFEAENTVLSLETGLPAGAGSPENILIGTEDRIVVLGYRQGAMIRLWSTEPEPGARFTDLATGDLDGDGIEEVVAAASGTENIYVYRPPERAGQENLELVGIRLIPGRPLQVEVFEQPDGNRGIAVLYQSNENYGLVVYYLTERGFAQGPVLENLPGSPQVLEAGDFTESPGQELALGGNDGIVRVVEPGVDQLRLTISTNVLGARISALSAGGQNLSLAAGTPGSYVFIFSFPVGREPVLALATGEPVYSLGYAGRGRLAVGTATGGLQVLYAGVSTEATGKYTIKPGDTLWLIAGRFGTTVEELKDLNNITEVAMIYPGQVILVPAGRKV